MNQQEQQMGYTECFIAFIDVLGFKSLVKKSEENPAVLSVLTRALKAMAEVPSGTKQSRHQDAEGNWIERQWRVQTRAFSDTIVIFMPTETGSISQMLFMVRYLHDRMLELKLCMRGAVTIGSMYWSDAWSRSSDGHGQQDDVMLYERGRDQNHFITLGPGLIDAYRLESECAIYPRILVSRQLVDYVSDHRVSCSPFGPYHPPDRPLTDFFRSDADGLHFLDLLHPDITRNDTERIVRTKEHGRFSIRWKRDNNTHDKVMKKIRALVKNGCKHSDEKIRAKYEWLKSYAASISQEKATRGN